MILILLFLRPEIFHNGHGVRPVGVQCAIQPARHRGFVDAELTDKVCLLAARGFGEVFTEKFGDCHGSVFKVLRSGTQPCKGVQGFQIEAAFRTASQMPCPRLAHGCLAQRQTIRPQLEERGVVYAD